jgi:hypothetical protein
MRSKPGPGGTLHVELDGMGVTWQLRPSAEGVRIVQHGGDWPGQHAGFIMVPERGFALTVLTNSDGGTKLISDLFTDDWALRRFAGVSNLPAKPRKLSRRELAPYEGLYIAQIIDPPGVTKPGDTATQTTKLELKSTPDGRLRLRATGTLVSAVAGSSSAPAAVEQHLAFYRKDYVRVYDQRGELTPQRADFLRGHDRNVQWLRFDGRLYRH